MIRNVMTTLVALFAVVLFLFACSKEKNLGVVSAQSKDVSKMAPAPMPVDTLELDTLNVPGFN